MIIPERFKNLTDEELLKLSHTDFLKSEVIELIKETILSDFDETIAILKYTRLKTNEEIAEAVMCDAKTVINHLKTIPGKIRNTLLRLPKQA